jgi:hypothetical protein
MTVAELISELQKLPAEAQQLPVVVFDGQGGAAEEVSRATVRQESRTPSWADFKGPCVVLD